MKIKSAIIAAMIFTLLTAAVSAQSNINVLPVDLSDNSVTVSGICENKGANHRVNILIETPDKIPASSGKYEGVIAAQKTVFTNSEGAFNANLKFNDEKSGYYNVKIAEECGKNFFESQFFFASQTDKNNLIRETINIGSENEIKSKLNEIYLYFGLSDFEPAKCCDETVMAKAIKAGCPYAENDFGKVQQVIKDTSVLDLYNSSKKDKYTDTNGNLLYTDILKTNEFDSEYNSTLFNAYGNILNSSGREKVLSAVSGKKFKDVSSLTKAMADSIFANGITYTYRMGTKYIEELITKNNTDALKADFSEVLNSKYRGKAFAYLAEKKENFNNSEDVLNKLKSLIKEYKENDKQSGGGISGGGSPSVKGDSVSGNVPGDMNDTDTKQEPSIIYNHDKTEGFIDIENVLWAKNEIEALRKEGVLSGYSDNSFRPDDFVKREEFVKMLCCIRNIEVNKNFESVFKDVEQNVWYAPYVDAAYANKIIAGNEDKTFGTGSTITRQDALVMLYRLFELSDYSGNADFSDYSEVADYAKEAVSYFTEKGIISGYEDNTFRPAGGLTRAESAKILYKCFREEVNEK